MIDNQTKLVFISYSRVKSDYVRSIVERLCSNGVQVLFDQYDLKHGDHLTPYMEQSVNNPDVDFVLVFSDKTYTAKANGRIGGVGIETTILCQEVYNKIDQKKVIPVVIEHDGDGPCIPTFLRDLFHVDFTGNDFEKQYESLLRTIYNKPEYRRPKLGKAPAWLEDESEDYSEIRKLISSNHSSDVVFDRTFYEETAKLLNEIINSNFSDIDSYKAIIDKEKICRDFIVDYFIQKIKDNDNKGINMGNYLEYLDNILIFKNDMWRTDLASFFKWELCVVFVALLIKYEKYMDLSILIRKPFFTDRNMEPQSFFDHDVYCRRIEEDMKNESNSKLLSMQADLLVGRTYIPYFDSNDLSSADLILYHLSFLIKNRDYWFPRAYIYQNGPLDIWRKMQSRTHCSKLYGLLGVDDNDSLRKLISETDDPGHNYPQTFSYAPWVTDYINVNMIGKYD